MLCSCLHTACATIAGDPLKTQTTWDCFGAASGSSHVIISFRNHVIESHGFTVGFVMLCVALLSCVLLHLASLCFADLCFVLLCMLWFGLRCAALLWLALLCFALVCLALLCLALLCSALFCCRGFPIHCGQRSNACLLSHSGTHRHTHICF